MSEPWRHLGACKGRDTNYWFPEQTGSNEHNPAAQLAKSICKTCPVITECLDHAMTKPENHGIWGGLTAEERRGIRLRRTRNIWHGSRTGYEQHRRWGEPACDDCKRAHAEYTAATRRIRNRAKTRNHIEGAP